MHSRSYNYIEVPYDDNLKNAFFKFPKKKKKKNAFFNTLRRPSQFCMCFEFMSPI